MAEPLIPPDTEKDETEINADGRKKRLVSGEIAAMADIEKVLESLDDGEQRRVMFWLCDKYEFYVTAVPKLEAK